MSEKTPIFAIFAPLPKVPSTNPSYKIAFRSCRSLCRSFHLGILAHFLNNLRLSSSRSVAMRSYLLVVVLILLNSVIAFRPQRAIWFATKLGAKVDGITVEGELMPTQNNLLVKVKEASSSTSGGIIIPDKAKTRPNEGTVVIAGPGRIHPETGAKIDMAVKEGEGVIYGKYDGSELKLNEVGHQMIKDDDVLLKYTGGDPLLANVEPVKDYVLVQMPPKTMSSDVGLIIVTAEDKEKRSDWGTVAKIGPGRQAANGKLIPIPVEPGDGVRYRDHAGADVKLEGVEFQVVRATEIFAKWKF